MGSPSFNAFEPAGRGVDYGWTNTQASNSSQHPFAGVAHVTVIKLETVCGAVRADSCTMIVREHMVD